MARVKPKRHGVHVDMTAMCDVAWLLLTFFILTTQFKKPDVEHINPPSSISETLLDEKNVMTVNVTPDGRFYFIPTQNASDRLKLLDTMRKKYNMPEFTSSERDAFQRIVAVGVPMNKLKSYLALPEDERKSIKQLEGVPLDSVRKQIIDWIVKSKIINQNSTLAVKGDQTTAYPKMKKLFEGLRDENFLQFTLITTHE